MAYLGLDETVRDAVNSLAGDDIKREVSYAFEHELLWYGIDAVIHAHMIKEFSRVAAHESDADEIISRYSIRFGHQALGMPGQEYHCDTGLIVSVDAVEKEGVFIPIQKFLDASEKAIELFAADYLNVFLTGSGRWRSEESGKNAEYLTRLAWTRDTFKDKGALRSGIRFAIEMWSEKKKYFEIYQAKYRRCDGRVVSQPAHVTELGRRLIEYYDGIMRSASEDVRNNTRS